MKAILIFDMPSCCNNCPCYDGMEDRSYCNHLGKDIGDNILIIDKDCPLIPVENLKMCGYDFEELLIFAEACRKADVKEEDLHAFIRNSESAFNYIYEKLLEHLDEKINEEFR